MQEENKDKKASPLYSEFAYDDAYRTMETECDDIVIPFVNYFYNENYDKNAKITRLRAGPRDLRKAKLNVRN